jgi:uncharacterized protein HemX
MTEVGWLKAVEVLVLLAAGAGFVWWQLSDVKRAQQRSQAEREKQQAQPGHTENRHEPEPPR